MPDEMTVGELNRSLTKLTEQVDRLNGRLDGLRGELISREAYQLTITALVDRLDRNEKETERVRLELAEGKATARSRFTLLLGGFITTAGGLLVSIVMRAFP